MPYRRLEFTMKLALNNYKVAWAHNAVVYDEKPITLKQSWNQRKRWMQGHADCASRYLGPLFKKAFREGDLIAFDCAVYLFQPIRLVFIGLITIMMWIQTVFPESPFYNLKYVFSHRSMVRVRNAAVSLWSFGGAFGEKIQSQGALRLFDLSFYCITWIPITIQGFMSKNNKDWSHTQHSRKISISILKSIKKEGIKSIKKEPKELRPLTLSS